MGLIKELVLLPVAPVRGVAWVAERIAEQVEAEQGAGRVHELEAIEEAKRRGEITEEEAAERQDRLLEQTLSEGR
jgi:hypothetical protein